MLLYVYADVVIVIVHADDVVVMSAEELQSLLDMLHEYGRDFGVNFNSE